MAMPKDIGVIDLMLAVPNNDTSNTMTLSSHC